MHKVFRTFVVGGGHPCPGGGGHPYPGGGGHPCPGGGGHPCPGGGGHPCPGGGGHPCQGLAPPRATWPSSSEPADTVRPEFAANTALMYAGQPPGGNGQAACSTR